MEKIHRVPYTKGCHAWRSAARCLSSQAETESLLCVDDQSEEDAKIMTDLYLTHHEARRRELDNSPDTLHVFACCWRNWNVTITRPQICVRTEYLKRQVNVGKCRYKYVVQENNKCRNVRSVTYG